MSGTYSFLPYARQGIANSLTNVAGNARGTFTVKLNVKGDSITEAVDPKTIEVYGPGDIIGIDPRQIFKTDPHHWITNFEPNYLAFVEFYDEDFLWRYTPVAPSNHRLNPWIALVVLEASEFTEGKNMLGRPMPYFTMKDAATLSFFPKADQLWAWAHVQFNGDLTNAESTILVNGGNAMDTALDKLQTELNTNPDRAYSRLVCPRKLLPNKTYHGFIIPAYKSGRLAGEGKDAAAIAAAKLEIAWSDNAVEYPYYYRWQFSTGAEGDFEYLVRLLKPKVADARVGRRLMDMTKPGANLQWVEDGDATNDMDGLLRLGGALKVPAQALSPAQLAEANKNENWAVKNFPHPFEKQIAGFLNLADDYNRLPTAQSNANARTESELPLDPNEDADPLIVPPIYGRWHAMVERVLNDRDGNPIDHQYNWLTELNLDPRFRVPAHFGTRVVQANQEAFMEAAWEQIGDVINANQKIKYAQFALAAGEAMHTKHLVAANAVSPAKAMLLTAPLQKRVLLDQATVFQTVRESVLPNSFLSMSMRKIARPRGRFIKKIEKRLPVGETVKLDTVLTQVSTGEIPAVPPKIYPPNLPSVDGFANSMEPKIPAWLKNLLRKYPWIKYIPLILAVLIILLLLLFGAGGALLAVGIAVAGVLVYIWRLLLKWEKALKAADTFRPGNQTPESVDQLPNSNNFQLVPFDQNFTPNTGGGTDSDDAARFKESLKDMFRLFQFTKQTEPKPVPGKLIPLAPVTTVLLDKLQPKKTVPAWTWQYINIPAWIKEQLPETFTEAMAYPRINKPMYKPLKEISSELFLPNIELIEFNSMTILETNQKFIESYMVGLNHEFARELLWREYVTDQRGSYFRQFWDVSSVLKDPSLANKTEKEKREPYYDIPELHYWPRASKLGQHDHRQPPGSQPKEEVVLVIRGELLKKYPTAVVYAHKAEWTKTAGTADLSKPRSLMAPEEGDKPEPDRKYVRTPLYQARVEPDIYFFGFDLTVDEACGESDPAVPDDEDNAGWFFVIKERPGEARFGLDIPPPAGEPAEEMITWNNLHWGNVLATPDGVLDVLKVPTPTLPVRPDSFFGTDTESQGEKEQYKDDIQVAWQNNVDAANLAYILYQVPMMVCVHTSEMLKQN